MNRMMRSMLILGLVAAIAAPGALLAQVAPQKIPDIAAKAMRHPDLDIQAIDRQLGELPTKAAGQAQDRLTRLGVEKSSARVDAHSGRFSTLLPAIPLVPGKGVGNNLRWGQFKMSSNSRQAREQAAYQAFVDYLRANQVDLGVDIGEFSPAHRIASHNDGQIYQFYIPRMIDGLPVRGSSISATINNGNLILVNTHQWGNRGASSNRPVISLDEARLAVEDYVSPLGGNFEKGSQLFLTMANNGNGKGYRYQRAWSLIGELEGDQGTWEALVDAHTGEILAFEDTNHYAEARGGVLPVTNDGVVPDGVEQAGWPMPFLTASGQTSTTGGNLTGSGSFTASLTGQYVRMSDNCGSSSLTQTGGLDFGTSGGTDCTTPGFGGSGNTHASRTGFYEINKIKEMARGQLPSNGWLQNQITSNMNINNTCNAFWNGSTINFYRSGGGCSNTGEIAGVFDHEWGHGMDANDVNGGIASPSGEGIADIYTALRLNDSCIGRNFQATVCSGNGDPCDTCTGVRDIDYLKRQSNNPHTFTWSNANCGSSVHCKGGVYSEAVWSLWKRKLQSAPYNYDNNTAHEIVTRLTFIGAGATGTWFSGSPPNGGCAGGSGYMNYLAADDDNGNLNDGTPHMTAIYQAFNDQQIACGTPTVQDSGCSGVPTAAPNVTATPGNTNVGLSWNTISGATSYEVFRTEGVFGCDFGKVKIASTTGTSYTDNSGLQNGRDYSYVVIPKRGAACFGPASACDTVQPADSPDFSVNCSPSSFSIQQGAGSSATCTVTSSGGYTGSVGLSCAGAPAGIGCSFSPSSVSPPSNGSANSTLTLSVNLTQSTGTFNFNVSGSDGATTRTAGVSVTVTPEGANGPQTAVYDSALGAPKCAVPGSSCDSVSLLTGRNTKGPEPNQPNTIDTCTDGASGTFHSDESNDRIVVSTLDGSDFAAGSTVQVSATVWAWNTGSSDTLDLYYTADANSPSWTLIGSTTAPGGGAQTITAQYVLPSGGLQAVRANFRYNGSASPCSGGSYDDADDLVFAVGSGGPPPPPPPCAVDDDFEAGATGWLNDAASTCSTGAYVTGNPTLVTNGGVTTQLAGSHSGTTSLFTATNSSAGVNDVDGGNCILSSPTWSVGAASTLSVWYWHGQRDSGGDASGDFFRLEYSTNGGSSWNTLASNGDSTSNAAWANATASVAAGSNVKIRVQCSDGTASGDLVECGIDDVSICQ